MGYRYIALVGGSACIDGALTRDAIRSAGLEARVTSGRFELFAGPDTPTIQLSNGAILIGHVFGRDGTPASEDLQKRAFPDDAQLRAHLVDNYWGDYLLIQTGIREASKLTIMRDPSGGVPCIYSLEGSAGFFTSDIGLAAGYRLYRKQIDWDYIATCLRYPHMKAERTALTGVRELLPGTTLTASGTGHSTELNWRPWDFVERRHRYASRRDAEAGVRHAVLSAVRAWAQLDRSVLLEMSGGLDSSIIATCLHQAGARVVCYTLVTPVPGADERQYAWLVSNAIGFGLHTEVLEFDDARFNFNLPSATVSPRIGSLQYAIDSVMGAAGARHDVTSFFTGAGGDTVFSYLTNATPAADAFRAQGPSAGWAAIRDLCTLHQCTVWTAGWLTLKKLMQAPRPPRSPRGAFINPAGQQAVQDSHPWFTPPGDMLPGDLERVFGLAGTQAYRDMAPRGSDRWIRMPLLSQPVMEACLRAPSWMWINGGRNRAIARAAFADMLPAEILTRRSKGNFVSYLGGFYRRNRNDIRHFILGGQLRRRGLLDDAALDRFLRQDGLPTRDRLFLEVLDLCMIENWVRQQD